MRRQKPLRLTLFSLAVPATAALLWLGGIALQQAVQAGNADALLMAWVLAFVVGLPVLLAILSLAAAFLRYGSRHPIVPHTGVKIPGAGQ
jgi:hypothetical protein